MTTFPEVDVLKNIFAELKEYSCFTGTAGNIDFLVSNVEKIKQYCEKANNLDPQQETEHYINDIFSDLIRFSDILELVMIRHKVGHYGFLGNTLSHIYSTINTNKDKFVSKLSGQKHDDQKTFEAQCEDLWFKVFMPRSSYV